jgi:hypothetical protein
VIIRNNRPKPSPNKNKPIAFVEELISNGVLAVSFRALLTGTPITVHISIFHREGAPIQTFDSLPKKELRKQLLRYFRKVHEEKLAMEAE